MNAYQQPQSSGIDWPVCAPALLYQPLQAVPRWPDPEKRTSIFASLDIQIAEYSAEHDALLADVRRQYVLPVDSSVTIFLNEHRMLPPILLEAAHKLKTCFRSRPVFALRAPLDDSGSQTLYAIAIWPGKVREVREALEKFDDTWWIQHSRKASGYLTFTYELV